MYSIELVEYFDGKYKSTRFFIIGENLNQVNMEVAIRRYFEINRSNSTINNIAWGDSFPCRNPMPRSGDPAYVMDIEGNAVDYKGKVF